MRRAREPRLVVPTAIGFVAAAIALPLMWLAWSGSGLGAARDAHGSAVLLLIVFHLLVQIVLTVMLGVALAWTLLAPRDARGRGVAWNAALVAWFTVPAWLLSVFTIYLSPELW
jgi:hypothetical protein